MAAKFGRLVAGSCSRTGKAELSHATASKLMPFCVGGQHSILWFRARLLLLPPARATQTPQDLKCFHLAFFNCAFKHLARQVKLARKAPKTKLGSVPLAF